MYIVREIIKFRNQGTNIEYWLNQLIAALWILRSILEILIYSKYINKYKYYLLVKNILSFSKVYYSLIKQTLIYDKS